MGGEAAPGAWGGRAAAFLAATAAALVACLRLRGDRPRLFVCLAMLFFAGSGAYLVRTPKAELPPSGGGPLVLKGRCERVFAPPDRYVVRSGDLRLLLRTDDSVAPGDSVVFEARVWPLAEKRRSHDFDYDRYLRHQGVQAKAYPRSVVRVTGHSDDAFTYCHALRERLVDKLERVVPDTLTRSMVEALCLGYLADIRPDTEELFRTTGTIHLLSVSGLHMGIIYVFFSFLFKLVGIRSPKSRLALIPLLWFFACLSGLSSPACRAAVILSVLLVGEAFRKDYVPLNAVAASAFFSLLVNPHLLYSVSFQMSYAAYTGIVVLYPVLSRPGRGWPRPARWCYNSLCASFAAQALIVPLTAYYFHTANVNSLLFNLVAIPLSTLLLYAGIALLVLPAAAGSCLAPAVTFVNRSLFFSLERFQEYAYNLTQIYPTAVHVILAYALLALCAAYLHRRSARTLKWLCVTLSLLVIYHAGWDFHRSRLQEVVVFQRYGNSSVVLNYRGLYIFLKRAPGDTLVPHYVMANDLAPLPRHDGFVNDALQYADNRLRTPRGTLRIADRRHPATETAGVLIVTENIYPPREKPSATPRLVVLDDSNSRRCREEWARFCHTHGIPMATTESAGSIRIPL